MNPRGCLVQIAPRWVGKEPMLKAQHYHGCLIACTETIKQAIFKDGQIDSGWLSLSRLTKARRKKKKKKQKEESNPGFFIVRNVFNSRLDGPQAFPVSISSVLNKESTLLGRLNLHKIYHFFFPESQSCCFINPAHWSLFCFLKQDEQHSPLLQEKSLKCLGIAVMFPLRFLFSKPHILSPF